jgi:hypothetical protein
MTMATGLDVDGAELGALLLIFDYHTLRDVDYCRLHPPSLERHMTPLLSSN